MAKSKIEDIDLYALLDLEITATESEIKKAYRKKALQCHPDKNPDDPKAAETFHELSRALQILTDVSARNAYDRVLKAKQAAKLRNKELDSKRQKLKDDLERKEREAELNSKAYKTFDNRTDEEKLQAEIERLQKEGSRLLEEEQKQMQQEINNQSERLTSEWDSSGNRIKIKWSASKTDETNGGYNEEILRRFLKKYGDIVALIISGKKKGSALVEFATKEASEMAIEYEKGLSNNPLTLKWVSSSSGPKGTAKQSTLVSERDYESLVLTKLRQAAERQKLIEQMLEEEKKS